MSLGNKSKLGGKKGGETEMYESRFPYKST